MGQVTNAQEGDGAVLTLQTGKRQEVTVRAQCGSDERGGWYCTTHGRWFVNNLQMQLHTANGSHVMAWYCSEHDTLEVP